MDDHSKADEMTPWPILRRMQARDDLITEQGRLLANDVEAWLAGWTTGGAS
jgi:hypothetical protein